MALRTLRARTTAALAAATLVTGGAAFAQQQPQQAPQQAQPQADIEPVTDAEIDKFAAANSEVSTIAASAQAELQSAEDKATAQKIQADAQKKMITAIKDEGLTAERFTQIVQLARTDEALAKKLRAKMDSQG